MSIEKRREIIERDFLIQTEKESMKKILADKSRWTELTEKERAEVVECLHMNAVANARQRAALSVDHQKTLHSEGSENWFGNLAKPSQDDEQNDDSQNDDSVEAKRFKRYRPVIVKADNAFTSSKLVLMFTPSLLGNFASYSKRYQYFRINKISVKFVANSANNLSPIICRYIPPMPDVDNIDALNKKNLETMFITKYAESAGTNWGFISINTPGCLIKTGKYDSEGEFHYDKVIQCQPQLCTDRIICNYKDLNQYIDYGYFMFESRNDSAQSFIAIVSYKIDFYSGYDFDSAQVENTIVLPSSEGDNEGDDGKTDDEGDDGKTDDENEGESNVPDTTPSNPSSGSAAPKGMIKRTYRKK